MDEPEKLTDTPPNGPGKDESAAQGNFEFGEALRQLRDCKGLTQRKLAEMMTEMMPEHKVSQQTVAHWENGRMRPRPRNWECLLGIFGADSVLAEFARGGEYLGNRKRSVILGFTSERGAPRRPPAEASEDRQPFLREDLRDYLPVTLHKNVEKMVVDGRVRLELDYLSDKLAIELKIVRGGWANHSVSLGIHQLDKARRLLGREAALTEKPRPQPAFILLLVIPEHALSMDLHRLMRLTDEARLFDMELVVATSMADAASRIATAEAEGVDSILGGGPDDYEDDY